MIHYLTEGGNGNSELKSRIWYIPDGVLKHLQMVKGENKDKNLSSNPTTKEAMDHLNDMISWNTADGNGRRHGVTYQEMKRIKNWFDKNQHAVNSIQYELYGGDVVKNWVNGQLTNAVEIIKKRKEAEKAMGKSNSYNKEHSKNGSKVGKVDDKTPTYNPATGDKQSLMKELSAMNESDSKNVIISTSQKLLLETLNPTNFKSDIFDRISNAYKKFSDRKFFKFLYDYLSKELGSPISSGSSRIVYNVDDDIIVKVAFNERGVEQNKVECDAYDRTSEYKDLFAKIYSHSNDYITIIEEQILSLEELDENNVIKELFNIDSYDTFERGLTNIELLKNSLHKDENEIIPYVLRLMGIERCNRNLELLIRYLYNNTELSYEVIGKSNCGIAKRGNETWLVILDNGFDGNVCVKYCNGYDFGKLNV